MRLSSRGARSDQGARWGRRGARDDGLSGRCATRHNDAIAVPRGLAEKRVAR
jgi:hypothetical protein